MPAHRFEIRVAAQPERVFERLANFAEYRDWLPASRSFGKTTKIEPYPIVAGSTYVDSGSLGARSGRVIVCEAPRRLCFEQPQSMPLAGRIAIAISYELNPDGDGTHVVRELDLRFHGLVALMSPVIMPMFISENQRILDQLERSFR